MIVSSVVLMRLSTREQLAEAARRAQQGGEAMAGAPITRRIRMRFLSNADVWFGVAIAVADCGDHLVAPATGIAVRLIHSRWPVGCRIQQQGDIHEHDFHGGDPLPRKADLTTASNALARAGQTWFIVAATGQLIFAWYMAALYGFVRCAATGRRGTR